MRIGLATAGNRRTDNPRSLSHSWRGVIRCQLPNESRSCRRSRVSQPRRRDGTIQKLVYSTIERTAAAICTQADCPSALVDGRGKHEVFERRHGFGSGGPVCERVSGSPSLARRASKGFALNHGRRSLVKIEEKKIEEKEQDRVLSSRLITLSPRLRVGLVLSDGLLLGYLRPKTMMVMSSFCGWPLANLRTSARIVLPSSSAWPPLLAAMSPRSRSTP